MKTLKRILPVIFITGFIILISLLLYNEMIKHEKERCWNELSSTAQYISTEIAAKFQDEIVKLHLVETIMLQDDVFSPEDIAVLHLDTLQPTTIFSRIDILFPDNTLVSNQTTRKLEGEFSFESIVAKGEYLTNRKTDPETGMECVYYILPVMKNEELVAVVVGMIDAKSLFKVFQPTIYNEHTNICLIDIEDGCYIMDSWHEELGNVYEQEEREKVKGYEEIDLQNELRNNKTGAIAFISRTTGKPLYMYYTPVVSFHWQLAIFTPEDELFEDVFALRKVFLLAGLFEVILLIVYFLWNLHTVVELEKRNEEIRKQREQLRCISYLDTVTSLYNRTKYTETLVSFKDKDLPKTGVAYIDLNGLKQINDTQSHDAGDYYIQCAAQAMSQIFGNNCYRIGGDEFVILTTGMERNVFLDKIADLQQNMIQNHVSISIGFIWEELCHSLDALLKEAEKKMYEEKELYYQTHDRKR